MTREVCSDEMTVLIDRSQPALAHRLALVPEQLPRERPVDQAHRMFEAAGPMRSARVRALFEPRIQQLAAGFRMTLVLRQVPRLRESQQLRMSARLPQIFDVAD